MSSIFGREGNSKFKSILVPCGCITWVLTEQLSQFVLKSTHEEQLKSQVEHMFVPGLKTVPERQTHFEVLFPGISLPKVLLQVTQPSSFPFKQVRQFSEQVLQLDPSR